MKEKQEQYPYYLNLSKHYTDGETKQTQNIHTFSPAEILVRPSASLTESAPMPVDGNTANNIVQSSESPKQ